MTTADNATTGRYLVLLDDDFHDGPQELNRVAGIRAADSAVHGLTDPLWEAEGLVMRETGVALVSADPDQVRALAAAAADPGPIAVVEPERYVHAITAPTTPGSGVDEEVFTWGLQAVGAQDSTATGHGVSVAVLDTGFDLTHPDFTGRAVTSSSFVQGEEVQDGNGHGTHCIGTSCGPRSPVADSPGYGIAYEAGIFAGKVLSNRGSGADGGILSGISWAIANHCQVVSMSLGSPSGAGVSYSRVYEKVAARALAKGTLIVAAAGNESERNAGIVRPIGHPANCPSILAVGAVDVSSRIAPFSCGTVDAIGAVDLVGPGVDVLSSWPAPIGHRRISGTSMATPHAAGVAALISQATGATGYTLWARLAQTARRLPLFSTDVGAGMVQAP
jgi:subtilisin